MDGGLEFEDVLDGFDDQDVGAAIDEAADLIEEEIDDLAGSGAGRASGLRRRAGGRSGRWSRRRSAGGLAVLYSVGDAAGEFGGGAVQLVGALAEAVFLQLDQAAAEGVGFEDIARRLRGSRRGAPR